MLGPEARVRVAGTEAPEAAWAIRVGQVCQAKVSGRYLAAGCFFFSAMIWEPRGQGGEWQKVGRSVERAEGLGDLPEETRLGKAHRE